MIENFENFPREPQKQAQLDAAIGKSEPPSPPRFTDEELGWIIEETARTDVKYGAIRYEAVHALATELQELRTLTAGIAPERMAAMAELAKKTEAVVCAVEQNRWRRDSAATLTGLVGFGVTIALIRRAAGTGGTD